MVLPNNKDIWEILCDACPKPVETPPNKDSVFECEDVAHVEPEVKPIVQQENNDDLLKRIALLEEKLSAYENNE